MVDVGGGIAEVVAAGLEELSEEDAVRPLGETSVVANDIGTGIARRCEEGMRCLDDATLVELAAHRRELGGCVVKTPAEVGDGRQQARTKVCLRFG